MSATAKTFSGRIWIVDPTDHWQAKNPGRLPEIIEACGFIPSFIEQNTGTCAERINKAYAHGGGWQPFGKSEWTQTPDGILQFGDPDKFEPEYPGDQPDPPIYPYVETRVDDETLRIYPHAWVSITQKDGTFEVARMD